MNVLDDFAFSIELRELHLCPELGADVTQVLLDLRKCRGTVELGLAHSQEIQVRAVDDGDLHESASPSSHSLNRRMSSSDSWASDDDCGAAGAGGAAAEVGAEAGSGAPSAPLNAKAARESSSLTAESANRFENASVASG